jgi:hypothetical protein
VVEVEGGLEVEELVMIMIRRKGERKNTKSTTKSDLRRGGSKRKRKRKNEIKKIKIPNTIQILSFTSIQKYRYI